MALIARLFVNDHPIGIISAQRIKTGDDGVHTYLAERWVAQQREFSSVGGDSAEFQHQEADGAEACIARALDALKAQGGRPL